MITLVYREKCLNTANLHLKGHRVSKISPLTPSIISITECYEPERVRVERFIKNVYEQSYFADICVEYPLLMSVCNADGDILAAVGFRYAAEEPLFLEQYTNSSIETVLNCKRGEIAEIGNLASAGKGASIFLFAALASYLDQRGIKYAAVTGTNVLYRYFEKIGLQPRIICDATPAALKHHNSHWGSYYDAQPCVMAGSIKRGVKRINSILGARFEDCRPRLFPRLYYKLD